jgi:hypothetical protein
MHDRASGGRRASPGFQLTAARREWPGWHAVACQSVISWMARSRRQIPSIMNTTALPGRPGSTRLQREARPTCAPRKAEQGEGPGSTGPAPAVRAPDRPAEAWQVESLAMAFARPPESGRVWAPTDRRSGNEETSCVNRGRPATACAHSPARLCRGGRPGGRRQRKSPGHLAPNGRSGNRCTAS